MPSLKRFFMGPYIAGLVLSLGLSVFFLWQGVWAWGFVLLTLFPALWLTVIQVFIPRLARTSRFLWLGTSATLLGCVLALTGWPDSAPLGVSLGLAAGWFLYVFWYSEYQKPQSRFLSPGDKLPTFQAFLLFGEQVSSSTLKGTDALILFYRGNWCPVCTAQIDELAKQYDQLKSRGIRVILISPQPDVKAAQVASRVQIPFEFWTDRGNKAAQKLEIVDPAGLPLGMELLGYGPETPVPTVLLVNKEGRIIYSDQAENYRLRPEPSAYLEAYDRWMETKDSHP